MFEIECKNCKEINQIHDKMKNEKIFCHMCGDIIQEEIIAIVKVVRAPVVCHPAVEKPVNFVKNINYKTAPESELREAYNYLAIEMGDDQFFTRKELNYLPEILMDEEPILAFASGIMESGTWLITLTDRRIIFLDKGMIYGLKQSFINLDKVNTVSGSTGIFFGTITITDGAKDRIITNVWKKTVKNFTNKTQEAIDNLRK